MTEAAHQMASNPLPPAPRKPGSVGPGTGVGISIMDAEGQHLAQRRARRSRHQGPERHSRLREQSRGQRHVVRRRLVPHRRSGLPRRRRLSHARRTPQGTDQSRRREDLAARDRRSAARASGGRRGGLLRRAASDVGRGGGRGGRAERSRRPKPSCWRTARAAGRLQAAQADPHHRRRFPRTATGKIQRRSWSRKAFAEASRREDRHRRRRRDRRLHRRAAGARRRRRRRSSRAARTCRRCRSAACASSAPTAISKCAPQVTGDLAAIGPGGRRRSSA